MRGLNTKNIGNSGENMATEYLIDKGYKIIGRNIYIGAGELDIVAKDNDTLVFVEVKSRNNYSFGSPLEAITKEKIKNIIHTAKLYIASKHYYNVPVRFDVIGIVDNEIEHIKDAFCLN